MGQQDMMRWKSLESIFSMVNLQTLGKRMVRWTKEKKYMWLFQEDI